MESQVHQLLPPRDQRSFYITMLLTSPTEVAATGANGVAVVAEASFELGENPSTLLVKAIKSPAIAKHEILIVDRSGNLLYLYSSTTKVNPKE